MNDQTLIVLKEILNITFGIFNILPIKNLIFGSLKKTCKYFQVLPSTSMLFLITQTSGLTQSHYLH